MKLIFILSLILTTSAFARDRSTTFKCFMAVANEVTATKHNMYGAQRVEFEINDATKSKSYISIPNSYDINLGAEIYFEATRNSYDLDIFITDQITEVKRLTESGDYEQIKKAGELTIGNMRTSFGKSERFSMLIRDNKSPSIADVEGLQESIYSLNCEKK